MVAEFQIEEQHAHGQIFVEPLLVEFVAVEELI
jgi:hypothetical protein